MQQCQFGHRCDARNRRRKGEPQTWIFSNSFHSSLVRSVAICASDVLSNLSHNRFMSLDSHTSAAIAAEGEPPDAPAKDDCDEDEASAFPPPVDADPREDDLERAESLVFGLCAGRRGEAGVLASADAVNELLEASYVMVVL